MIQAPCVVFYTMAARGLLSIVNKECVNNMLEVTGMFRHVRKWLHGSRCVFCIWLLMAGWFAMMPIANAEVAEKSPEIVSGAKTAVVEAEGDSPEEIMRQSTGIVLLGNPRYLQAEYMDILNRYFIRCYSQYRYPTEYGALMQEKFVDACNSVYEQGDTAGIAADSKADAGKWRKAGGISQLELPALVTAMDKEQVLFLRVDDVLLSSWRRSGWDWGADVYWEATVEAEAVLADRRGVVRREKVMRRIGEKYTPSSALQEAYTYCIRYLQQKEFFTQAVKSSGESGK